jgi:SAM-dependent methyltransferase
MTRSADPSREVEFFDHFQAEHGDYDVLGRIAYQRLLSRFAKLVRPRAREKCIDLGCGTGAFTRRLATFDLELLGVDISPRSIEYASQQSPGQRYEVRDIMATGLPDNSMDIAVFSGVLHHLPTAKERATALKEARRLLRPGGRLFGFDPHRGSPSMWLYRDPRSPLYSSVGKTENEVLLGRAQMTNELTSAGFDDVSADGIGGITYRYVEGTLARRVLPLYNLYEIATMLPGLGTRIGTFVISFGRKAA